MHLPVRCDAEHTLLACRCSCQEEDRQEQREGSLPRERAEAEPVRAAGPVLSGVKEGQEEVQEARQEEGTAGATGREECSHGIN